MSTVENGLFSNAESSFQGDETFFRSVLKSMEEIYLNRNPTAKSIMELLRSVDPDHQISFDHIGFRTLGIDGHGLESIAKFFLDYGYVRREELRFPPKKVIAHWFSPPKTTGSSGNGDGSNGLLPRIFITEYQVNELSPQAQEIVKKYVTKSGNGGRNHAALASAMGSLTWEKPSYNDFQLVAKEGEYAAWVLAHGYAINHLGISLNGLKSQLRSINNFNQFIEEHGFIFNSEGGQHIKESDDGLLLQSSLIADSLPFQFADGIEESIAFAYIEFVERLVLPQYKDLPAEEVKEFHRRDGFEVGNAYKILESPSKHQVARREA